MSAIVNGNGTMTEKPAVRLCHIIKWPDYDGYGFNLHAEKSKPGQYIGKVDEGSPAEAAGLKEGDKILEVNGSDISGEDHKAVVTKIKALPEETQLLVADKASLEYFASNNVTISEKMKEVIKITTPRIRPQGNQVQQTPTQIDQPKEEKTYLGNGLESSSSTSTTPAVTPEPRTSSISTTSDSPKSQRSVNSSSDERIGQKLNLNMSVAELKKQLANRKKYDPKKEVIDVKKKHAIVDSL